MAIDKIRRQVNDRRNLAHNLRLRINKNEFDLKTFFGCRMTIFVLSEVIVAINSVSAQYVIKDLLHPQMMIGGHL